MEELKVGDVVQLKSGGPEMTISDVPGDGHSFAPDKYICVWFEGSNKKSDTFKGDMLNKVDEN